MARRTSGRRHAPTQKVLEMAARAAAKVAARGGNSSNSRKRKVDGGDSDPVGTLGGAQGRQKRRRGAQGDF
jgi:hypothetical protein